MATSSTKRRAGFTMIELMIVVTIIGVLAAVAIPAFRNYVMRSRTIEAFDFIGEIHLREESYRAEFGAYANVPAWSPATYAASGYTQPFDATIAGWRQLGAMPDANVRFQYQVLAGPPGAAVPVPNYPSNDFWFVSHAQGDLDGDGILMAVEGYAMASQVFVSYGASPIGGPYCSQGWE